MSADQSFYVSHSFPCVDLEEMLLELRGFMELHEREVVAVRICPDW